MLTGMPPYYSKDREKLFNKIKTEQVKFHSYMSKNAVDILTKFFIKDPEKRLGSGPNGVKDIKSHPFFASINWDSILEKKIKPPFTPKLRSETDTNDPDFLGRRDTVNGVNWIGDGSGLIGPVNKWILIMLVKVLMIMKILL